MREYVCAHLPVEDNAPDEAQGQFVVPIHDVCPADVYEVHLRDVTDNETC